MNICTLRNKSHFAHFLTVLRQTAKIEWTISAIWVLCELAVTLSPTKGAKWIIDFAFYLRMAAHNQAGTYGPDTQSHLTH